MEWLVGKHEILLRVGVVHRLPFDWRLLLSGQNAGNLGNKSARFIPPCLFAHGCCSVHANQTSACYRLELTCYTVRTKQTSAHFLGPRCNTSLNSRAIATYCLGPPQFWGAKVTGGVQQSKESFENLTISPLKSCL